MVGGLPQPAAAGSSGLRPEDKARRYTFDKAGRGRPLPSRVAAGFSRGSRRSCGEERRAPCLRPRSGSALPASGNSVGTAGELAPDPTRGHVPSVHDVLSGGVDQERLVEQATRGRPARAAPRYHPGRSGRGALVRGSHRNPHRRRQTPPRDGAGSAFAALIPIPDTEWCTVSSPRSGSNASAGYPQ